MKREPVAVINATIALVEAALALWMILDENIDESIKAGIMGVALALGNLAKVIWTRKQVTPVVDPRDDQGRELKPQ